MVLHGTIVTKHHAYLYERVIEACETRVCFLQLLQVFYKQQEEIRELREELNQKEVLRHTNTSGCTD